jgi:hypothetical protein
MLNGFTLTGPDFATGTTVRCVRSCRVDGPGSIRGGYIGVEGLDPVTNDGQRVRIEDADVASASWAGVNGSLVRIRRATIIGNGNGVWAGRAIVRQSTITGNDGYGIRTAILRMQSTSVDGKRTRLRSEHHLRLPRSLCPHTADARRHDRVRLEPGREQRQPVLVLGRLYERLATLRALDVARLLDEPRSEAARRGLHLLGDLAPL